jgi:hypothetical protein
VGVDAFAGGDSMRGGRHAWVLHGAKARLV